MALTAVHLQAVVSATGVPGTAAAIRSVGTEAEATGRKLGLMRRFMGSFLGQQLIFGLISKAIATLDTQVRDVFTKTNEWDAATAQLNAVLASTHGVAGMTKDAIIGLANSLSATTTYNNSAVLSAENLILTFTSIGKDIFPQTTQAVLDMATALKEDTKSAAIQLGKALQDPILGVTALRRVGVNFSKDNQEMLKQWVETGQTARAQKFILDEITREFGGSASAAAGTFSGKLQVLANQFDIVKEAVGNALIPVLSDLFTKLAPGVKTIGEKLPAALKAAGDFFNNYLKQPLKDIKDIIGDVFGAIGALVRGFNSQENATTTLGTASSGLHTVLKAIGDLIKTLTPLFVKIGEIVGKFVKDVTNLTTALSKNKPLLIALGAALGTLLIPLVGTLVVGFVAWAGAAAAAAIATAAAAAPLILVAALVGALVFGIVELVQHFDQVKRAVGDAFGTVGSKIGEVAAILGGFKDGALKTFGDAWNGLGKVVGVALNALAGIVKAPFNVIIGLLDGFIGFIDSIQIHIPAIGVGPVHTPAFDWNGMGIPKIPYLAKGGVLGFGSAVVGEKGPELLTMGKGGAMVTPLGTQHLGAGGKMGQGAGGETHIHIHAPNTSMTEQMMVAAVRRGLLLKRGKLQFR